MKSIRILTIYCLVLLGGFSLPTFAGQTALKHFSPGSYQKLLDSHANKPFVLTIWSVTCATCLQKMAMLNELQKNHPDINIVMLTTDDTSAVDQVQSVLSENELTNLENWIFADENTQRLRYEIDPQWYGELPRTYFLDKNHERAGVSGALSPEDYELMFNAMLN